MIDRDQLDALIDDERPHGGTISAKNVNAILDRVRDAIITSLPHYFVQEADETVATCVHCGETDDGTETPNCLRAEPPTDGDRKCSDLTLHQNRKQMSNHKFCVECGERL
jgi:hypothetical protein